MDDLMEIDGLRVHARNRTGITQILDGVDLSIRDGEILGVVGETGSGKSLTALSILGLITDPIEIAGGSIVFGGQELTALSERRLRDYRGDRVAMIFQDPGTALNPFMRIGAQIVESIRAVQDVTRGEASERVPQLLKQVGMTQPELRARQYPHQLSGGMRQRAMIAMALGNRPQLLIADEPTTGLDVTVQAQILELLKDLNNEHDMAMMVITHDLAVVAGLCDRTVVMYAGQVIEAGPTEELFTAPRHPYTRMLLRAIPVIEEDPSPLANIPGLPPHPNSMPSGCRFHPRCPLAQADCLTIEPRLETATATRSFRCHHPVGDFDDVRAPLVSSTDNAPTSTNAPPTSGSHARAHEVLVEADGLSKFYASDRSGKKGLLAVEDASFEIFAGESLGLVGESGSGKSTLGRMIAQLEPITAGTVRLDGVDLGDLSAGELKQHRQQIQFVFQDPFSSLDPRQTVEAIISEPLRNFSRGNRRDRRRTVTETLDAVGLGQNLLGRYPHELSGGQRQRVGIARALVLRPRLLVLDEPVSALDVSVQAQIMNLLEDLQREFDLTYLFISHDLGVVHHLCDRVLVMYLGRIVEAGDRAALFRDALHPYAASLLSAVPVADPALERQRRPILLRGEAGDGADHDACQFEPRCPVAQATCREIDPRLEEKQPGHQAACHFPGSLEMPTTS